MACAGLDAPHLQTTPIHQTHHFQNETVAIFLLCIPHTAYGRELFAAHLEIDP